MTVISGYYSATWNSLAIGNLEVGGIRERYSWQGRPIRFDGVGMVDVDQLFMGTSMSLDFVCMEYDAAAIATMRWPMHSVPGRSSAAGLSMWEKAKPFVTTACRSGINPTTKTYLKTILAPNYELQLDFSGTKERSVPIRLLVFPVKYNAEGYTSPELPSSCSDMVFYTETNV